MEQGVNASRSGVEIPPKALHLLRESMAINGYQWLRLNLLQGSGVACDPFTQDVKPLE